MMSYICDLCEKTFAGICGYQYHVNNKVCEKYKCLKCDTLCLNNAAYRYHQTHNLCDKKLISKTQIRLKPIVNSDKLNINSDKLNINSDKLYTNFDDLTVDEYQKICDENLKLKTQPTQININKPQIYIDKRQYNRQYNIIVPPAFLSMDTYENIMRLCPNAMDQAVFKNPTNCIVDLVKSTNCNPNHPEFNSIMITNKRDGSAKVSDGKKFISVSRQKVIADLIDNKRELIQKHIDKHPGKYAVVSKRLENYLDVLENDDSQKELENELTYLLMDMKDVINSDQWKADLLSYLELNKTTEIVTT